ncbi:uncharacterized protein Dvar_36010 [Desulfosarcina variabilis str. Montpellier]|uniref:hypothetical protein n=1 Tax=Desulfosarcina variabilis TaxID=2300 RepID=UPI003AFA8FFF
MKKKFSVVSVVALIILTGCAAQSPIVKTQQVAPPSFDEYVNIPFKKFTNRMFLNDVKDKYIRLDADFGYLYDATRVGGYPSEEWVRIQIIKDSIGFDNVMVPKSESDLIFELMRGEAITIYGKTTVWSSSYKGIKQPDEIAIRVTKVERRKSQNSTTIPDITGWEMVNIQNHNDLEIKTYHNGGKTIIIQYKGGQPIGFWKAPIPQGQAMTTYCDKDGDGNFETVLTNNPYCE